MTKTNRKKAFICPTTHWDREWVMTFGQYRARLVKLIDNLLDIMEKCPEYTFYMDGQAAMLDDYLEIKPENKDRLSAYLKSGRLSAGPWYVLADQFLESGEATIRNLALGMSAVRKYGGEPLMIGYVPDSFGSIASLPMILEGFGIKSATFGRGRPYWNDDLPNTEFIWECPDGSSVLAVNHGYGNGLFLSYPDIWTDIFAKESYEPDPKKTLEAFMGAAAGQERAAALPALYFSVGADHMEPRGSLPGIVDYINKNQNEYELIFGSPADYMDYIGAGRSGVGALKKYTGALYGTYRERLFEGTLTSRIKTKQLNDKCDVLLSRELEPLCVMASYAARLEYPRGHLNDLWKQHILNHPHDSICSCNLDSVDRDMQARGEYIMNTGAYLRKEAINALSEAIDTSHIKSDAAALVVFNPLGHGRGGWVSGLVRIPRRFNYAAYELYDENNRYVPSRIVCAAEKNKDLESVYMTPEMLLAVNSKNADPKLPDEQIFTVLDVDFVAQNVPSMGYGTYSIVPSDKKEEIISGVNVCGSAMENEHIKVEFNDNATFDITDKKSGQKYKGLNYFADREEAGNTYQHLEFESTDERDTKNAAAKWKPAGHLEHMAAFETGFEFFLPENIAEGRRSGTLKPVPVSLRAALCSGLDYLEITVKIGNTCADHCLRAVFDIETDAKTSCAFEHFNMTERPADAGDLAWREQPFSEIVCVSGFGISTKGLPAYEAVKYDKGVRLYIELLRATGNIGSPAGANYPAPGAQCFGEHVFEYAIFPNMGALNASRLEKAANYRNGLLAAGTGSHKGQIPGTASFISLECEGETKPYISCLKQQENGGGIILRLWNPGERQIVKLSGMIQAGEIWSAALDGQKTGRLSPDMIDLPGQKISTFVIIPATP